VPRLRLRRPGGAITSCDLGFGVEAGCWWAVSSSYLGLATYCAFICIDALDECSAGHRMKLLGSRDQILRRTPSGRIFLTGRPHIRGEVENHLF